MTTNSNHPAVQAGEQDEQTESILWWIMRQAQEAKEPCGDDPESPAAVRNAKLAGIGGAAAQALGLVRGPDYPAPAAGDAQTAAARDVLAERQRQISAEGWTPEKDDAYESCDLADAAAQYVLLAAGWKNIHVWPWRGEWLKSTTPRRDLVKAGALILAEIERLDRAAAIAAQQGEGGAA
ncbi:hypothetical protein [Bordetella genomosp. 1]|uniref:Uncharacterized protein n=1 Tax=Bordetella genomosp. 1 TaxID=1395607 RepID=A0ABX4EX69_9BORD|nr:hypothetical protein [Bordetella genomosp. 1]OZI58737.1 hypothetical protein CAL27_18825 [Bordetella genomosp. 1]